MQLLITDELITNEEIGICSFIFGAEFEIPMPWPQERPPDDTGVWSQKRDDKSVTPDVRSVEKQFGVECVG